MELFSTLSRLAPALASGLITYGVSSNHAEAIALGTIAAGCAVLEWATKMISIRKGRQ